MEILINQSVHLKRTLNRSPIYLLTKFHRKPNQQKFHKSLGRLRPQVLAQGAQFYCKLPQRLQEMKMEQNQQELRSYVTNNLKSRLGPNSPKREMLHLNTFGEKTFRKQKCEVLTWFLEDVNEETSRVCVLCFRTICSPPPSRVDATNYPHLHGLKLADFSDRSRRLWSHAVNIFESKISRKISLVAGI